MEKHYIGRSISLPEAVQRAQAIIVAEVLEIGSTDAGAPGQAYIDQTRIRVCRSLYGALSGEVAVSYTCQSLPAASAETAPAEGETLLFFVIRRQDGSLRAIKAVPATPDAIQEASEAIARRAALQASLSVEGGAANPTPTTTP